MTASTRCPGRNRVVPRVEALEERALMAAGALDTSFGTDGQVVLSALGGGDEVARSVLVQPDGKTLVAGFTEDPEQGIHLRVTRLTREGTPDPDFGGGTRFVDLPAPVVVDVDVLTDQNVALALQPDGNSFKILVGSTVPGTDKDADFVVRRLNMDGSTDNGFGTPGTGTARINFALDTTSEDRLRAMVVDGQGRVVLAGKVHNGADFEFGVARLTRDGAPDNQFGTDNNGRVHLPFNGGSAAVTALAVQGDQVLVAGYDFADSATAPSHFAIVRLDNLGRLDTNFGDPGDGGRQLIDVAGNGRLNRAQAIAVQPGDGKIVLGGYSAAGDSGYDFALTRFDRDGRLDPGFGDGGKKIIQFSNDFTNDRATSVLIQDDQKIVVAGFHQLVPNASNFGFAVARLLPDGRPDPSYGGDGGKRSFLFTRGGAVQGDPNRTDDKAFAAALQDDGKVVLVGHFALSVQGRELFAVARLEADPPPRPPAAAPAPPPPSVLGIAGPFVVKLRKPALFQALLSDPGAAGAVFCFWMVTVGSGKKLRLVGSGVGPSFNFLPTAPGSYTVTLFAAGAAFAFAVKV